MSISQSLTEQSELCTSCYGEGKFFREDFQHFYFDCPFIQGLLRNSKKIFREDFKNEPKVLLINNMYNKTTNYEKLIAGIMCYIFFTHRNKTTNKILHMNNDFRRIIQSLCTVSQYFKMQTSRFIRKEIDPF